MKNLSFRFLVCVCSLAFACVSQAQNYFALNPLGSFGGYGDGSIRPGDQPWVDSNNMNQRGIAYDPITGNLVYVNTASGSGGSAAVMGTIEILDGTTGIEIGTLNTNGINGGNWADLAAGIADDGVVYICNQVTVSGSNPFKIYRWDSVSSVDPPVVAFQGTITPTQRYGSSMDIRGAGTNTQIIIGSMPGTTATNVVIFTTADGTNFSANVLGTDATTANFNDGIAFGPGNTFWAKRIGAPLRFMSFDLGAGTAVTLAAYTPDTMPSVTHLGSLAVDNQNMLLAAIEQVGGSVNGGPERVWLYDISNTNQPPAVLGFRDFPVNFQNATAPHGFLDFGGGRLYAAVTRNGILASSVDSEPLPPPIFAVDLFETNRVAAGQTARFQVFAYPNITSYQWHLNGGPLVGETNYFLEVPNVQTNDTGKVYSVVVSNANSSVASSDSVLVVINPADLFHLNYLWTASPGVSPGETNWYVGTGGNAAGQVPTERTIAYNALSNQLYLVFRSGVNVRVSVIDPDTGHLLYYLNTNGIAGGSIPLCAIEVADDGAIYACNSVAIADTANFRIYRWANSHPDTEPVQIFQGNPAPDVTSASYRWGDNMDVRGAGLNTEIIVDQQNSSAGSAYVGILHPADSSMTNWVAKGYVLHNVAGGPGSGAGGTGIGRSLQFGEGDTFWQKRYAPGGAPLAQSSYDPALPGTVAPLVVSSTGLPLYTNGAIGIGLELKLGAALSFANNGSAGAVPDTLNLYDLTAPETPVLLNRYNFPINAAPNGNRIGEVIFTTNYVFAIDANNGVMAFVLEAGPIPPPTFLTQPKSTRVIEGGSVALTATVDQNIDIRWFKDGVQVGTGGSYDIEFAQLSDAGNYWAVATNVNGSSTSDVATVTIELVADHYSLSQVWAATPGDTNYPYVTTAGSNTPEQRSFACHALSNQLIVVKGPPNSTDFAVHVVDADTGTYLYDMDVSQVLHLGPSEVGGANAIDLLGVDVSEDGSVYICCMSPNGSGGEFGDSNKMFRVYRWADSAPATLAQTVFIGDPANIAPGVNVRWGDTLAVRGGGVNTEIVVDSNDGLYVAVLKPADGSLTSFTNAFFSSVAPAGSIGRSLQFGLTNSVWQKRKGGNLYLASYNLETQVVTPLENIVLTSTLGGMAVDETRQFGAGIDYVGNASTPAALALYELSLPALPMLIARYNFPVNMQPNANFIGRTIIVGNRIYSLNGNNGIVAFNIVPPSGPALTITQSGGNAVISWTTNAVGFSLESRPLVGSGAWTNLGAGAIVGDQYQVTDPISGDSRFYRLRSP